MTPLQVCFSPPAARCRLVDCVLHQQHVVAWLVVFVWKNDHNEHLRPLHLPHKSICSIVHNTVPALWHTNVLLLSIIKGGDQVIYLHLIGPIPRFNPVSVSAQTKLGKFPKTLGFLLYTKLQKLRSASFPVTAKCRKNLIYGLWCLGRTYGLWCLGRTYNKL